MVVSDDYPNPYLYLHLLVVCDLSLFKAEVLKVIDVTPSQIMPNGWSLT